MILTIAQRSVGESDTQLEITKELDLWDQNNHDGIISVLKVISKQPFGLAKTIRLYD